MCGVLSPPPQHTHTHTHTHTHFSYRQIYVQTPKRSRRVLFHSILFIFWCLAAAWTAGMDCPPPPFLSSKKVKSGVLKGHQWDLPWTWTKPGQAKAELYFFRLVGPRPSPSLEKKTRPSVAMQRRDSGLLRLVPPPPAVKKKMLLSFSIWMPDSHYLQRAAFWGCCFFQFLVGAWA